METTATVLAETDKSENLTERELMVTYVFRNLVSRFREIQIRPESRLLRHQHRKYVLRVLPDGGGQDGHLRV